MLPTRFWEYVSRSTLKREAASVIMIWYLATGSWLLTRMTTEQAIVVWTGLQLAVFGVFAAAFGTDWISKQTTIAGPPQGPEGAGIEVKVPPQAVKVDGVVEGVIKVEEEPKING